MNRKIVLFVAIFFILLSSVAIADVIELKSGQRIEGQIIQKTDTVVEVDIGFGSPVEFSMDQVQQIISSDVSASSPPAQQQIPEIKEEAADIAENEGLQLVMEGKMEEGLKLIRQAIEQDPSGSRYLNYASILFGNGVQVFKSGDQERGKAILKDAEDNLNKALGLFDVQQEPTFVSQAYFLLGEIYFNAHNDLPKAKEFYQKALSFYEHPGALQAMESFSTP